MATTTIDTLELKIKSNAESATNGIKSLTATINTLKNSLKGGMGLGSIASDTDKLTSSLAKVGGSQGGLLKNVLKLGVFLASMKSIGKTIGGFISSANQYVEDLNLFNASMGDYTTEAKKYADSVSEIMGIDPAEWMKNQGVFMTITSGFGVASDRANTMSKNLTQLGYDISSFYNMDVTNAMQKLQSGISGELEPLRRLGYDLSIARLQEDALALGIKKKVSEMTQAEKAELRYHAIMTQVTTVQGDMARTLEAPANQIRIFKAQLEQTARSIGNIFIPMINNVLPYLIATAKVIRTLANSIASFFGFSLHDIDYSSVNHGASELEENLDNVTDSAKKAKSALLGIDELNVLSKDNSSGSDIASSIEGLGIDLPEYDFIGEAVSSRVDEIMKSLEPALTWIKEHIDGILDVVTSIGTGFLTWKISNNLITGLGGLKEWFAKNKQSIGITLMVSGITLATTGAYDVGYDGPTLENVLRTVIGDALIMGGSLLTLGTGPAGLIVGLGVSLLANIIGVTIGINKRALEEDMKRRFGEIELTSEQIQELANKIVKSELTLKLDIYKTEINNLENVQSQLEESIQQLNTLNIKLGLGLDISEDDYVTAIDTYIKNTEAYISQRQVTEKLAVSILLENTSTGDSLSTFTDTYYAGVQSELSDLGGKLKEVVSQGFVDGKWIPDEQRNAEITKLTGEIQSILDEIADVKFKAKLSLIEMNFKGTDFTFESFKAASDEVHALVEDELANLEEVKLTNLEIAYRQFNDNKKIMSESEAQKLLDKAKADIESSYNAKKLEISMPSIDFDMSTAFDAFSPELEKVTEYTNQSIEEVFSNGLISQLPSAVDTDVKSLVAQLSAAYGRGFATMDVSHAARGNIEEVLEAIQPTKEELENVASEYTNLGLSVPENISQGLLDINKLEALANGTEGIAYLIGNKLSTDETFLNLLSTCKDAGTWVNSSIAQGIKDSTTFSETEAGNAISVVQNGIEVAVLEKTDALTDNLKKMGIAISGGLTAGTEEGLDMDKVGSYWGRLASKFEEVAKIKQQKSEIFEKYGTNVSDGLLKGISNGLDPSKITSIWDVIPTGFKNFMGIHSPSTVFEGFGGNIVAGLMNGMKDDSQIKSSITTWGTNIKDWFTNSSNGDVNASAFEKFASNILIGFNNKINTSYTDTKASIVTWATAILGWFNDESDGKINATTFENIASNILNAFSGKIDSANGDSQNSITNWAKNIKKWFNNNSFGAINKTTFAGYASTIIDGFKQKIVSNYTTSKNSITTWASSIKTWFTGTCGYNTFYNIASDVISGFNAGINALYTSSEYYMKKWAKASADAFKEELDSHSPSRVFERIGIDTVKGYNMGIESFGSSTKDSINDWTSSFTDMSPIMSFAVDTSSLKYYNSDSFAKSVSADIYSKQDYRLDNGFSVEGMKEAVVLAMRETGLLEDVRRQADKQDKTIVQIGNRVIVDTISTQQKANGFVFAR